MNTYWFGAFIGWTLAIAGISYETGIWHAGASQDKADKKEIVLQHDDTVRGQTDSANYEVVRAAINAKLNALIPKVEAPNAKVTPSCSIPADVMHSIGEAVKSRTAG
jgi:hypothetical protein